MYPLFSSNESISVTEILLPMRDGVRLYTRYAVPEGKEKCPIIFIRTPYEAPRHAVPIGTDAYKSDVFTKHGYAVVVQHCRGRGDSEGICTPYAEREDGLDTLDFLRNLPFYNGEIFLTGQSYLASVHYCYLDAMPKDIKGACFCIQSDRMYERNFRCGMNYSLNNISFWMNMLDRRFPEQNRSKKFERPYINASKNIFAVDIPEITNGLLHNENDEFWTSDPRTRAAESISFPTLFVEGWYDFYIGGMYSMWERLTEDARRNSAMIVGPYGHATRTRPNSDYVFESGNLPADFLLEWFESVRAKTPYKYAQNGKVSYYSIGADKWFSSNYPRENQRFLKLWLEKDRLSEAPEQKGKLSYLYDPQKLSFLHKFGDAHKAFPPEKKDGVLSFLSAPFEKETAFFGKIKINLSVSSSCDDTAFFVRAYFVEDDNAYSLTESVGALSYFIKDYIKGTKASIKLETTPIAFTIKKGMRLRIDVSSESGIYMPHPNVKGHFAFTSETAVAKNTVFLGESFIELPFDEN